MPTKLTPEKAAEKVMVVAREDIFSGGAWHGVKSENIEKYVRIINKKHKFMARGDVEDDTSWQQIIPYMFYEFGGKYFLMQRNAGHTDKRLASNFSLGIGGHINRRDIKSGNIASWAKREFEEEADYKGRMKTTFVGLLNDDTNDVGRVHLGLVIKIEGASDQINVRDEHQSGTMVSFEQLGRSYKQMETWSQIIYDYLNTAGPTVMKNTTKHQNVSNVTGILPDWVIAQYIEEGLIKIDPLVSSWKDNIDQVSMDFHLGRNLKLFKSGGYRFVDTRKGLPVDAMEEIKLNSGDPFILEPGAFAIASTEEVLKLPKDILGRLEGKSSLARLGILVHSTAARFDPGWNGAPVLELGNLGPKPAILYCGMPICAFTFEKLSAPVKMGYEGSRSDRYSGSRDAVVSKIHEATRNGKKR
ncbi:dCTP deaminase [Candidatus Curtissbacteria bacterium]|nr:dCTP deaminase [Candidatus Curtissbacteria bacterium]